MTVDLTALSSMPRLLFAVPLTPLQGHRFQPTGFPGLGAATYQTLNGTSLLVESAQSMANRLELTVWDSATNDVVPAVRGISHVKVTRKDEFLTDTILEAHRLNSPYLLEDSSKTFFNELKAALGGLETGPVDRTKLAQVLLDYDVGSLIHGVFLAKKELAGGRLRVARALSAFIDADGVQIAPSGGVKNDHVNPSGDTGDGFGNVPFARDEFTAERITLYANLDLAQIRGYGLGNDAERLLVLLSLFKLRSLLDGNLRLRTACDFSVGTSSVSATNAPEFALPPRVWFEDALASAIAKCKPAMHVRTASYADELKSGKAGKKGKGTKDVRDGDDDAGED